LEEYPVKLLHEILESYSPSGSEASLAKLIRFEMESLGFESHIEHTGNVIGQAGVEGPEVLLCGHMDTVPGEIPVREENGFLYGRGAVDAKSSLATLIIGASRALKKMESPVRLRIACVVEEETSSRGFRAIVEEGLKPDFAIFGEPSGVSNMIVGYKGRIHLEVECFTNGGHSASPWLSKNSTEEAFGFWTSLRNSLLDNESASKFNALTGSLTRLNSFGPENSIPSQTRMSIDVRIPPQTNPSDVAGAIEVLADSYSRENPGVRIVVSIREKSQPYLADTHSKLVMACRGAIKKVTEEVPGIVRKTGTSDMNLLPPESTAIAYGPGDSRLDHTDKERIKISEYLKSIDVCAATLRQLSALARPRIEVSA
jgi:[amino group carrier protein]-lysine/ornithine hydrolase